MVHTMLQRLGAARQGTPSACQRSQPPCIQALRAELRVGLALAIDESPEVIKEGYPFSPGHSAPSMTCRGWLDAAAWAWATRRSMTARSQTDRETTA
jgi:hypothetical protein